MSLDGPLIAPSPVDKLLTKLDDPKVVASLNDLLDHADLLAVLVNGLDELLKRGDVISDSLTQTIAEMRDATTDSDAASALTLVDLPKLARSLTSLSAVLAEAGPVIAALMNSTLADPRAIQVVSVGAQAVTAGAARAREEQTKFSGVFSLLRALRDDDVQHDLEQLGIGERRGAFAGKTLAQAPAMPEIMRCGRFLQTAGRRDGVVLHGPS